MVARAAQQSNWNIEVGRAFSYLPHFPRVRPKSNTIAEEKVSLFSKGRRAGRDLQAGKYDGGRAAGNACTTFCKQIQRDIRSLGLEISSNVGDESSSCSIAKGDRDLIYVVFANHDGQYHAGIADHTYSHVNTPDQIGSLEETIEIIGKIIGVLEERGEI